MNFLHTRGRYVVDEQDRVVRLRGCNIGNWLLLEPWMICADHQAGCGSEKEIWDIVSARFGKQAKLDLIKAHRTSFFTEDDVERIASMGLNCVRLPIWWRAIADPEYGGDMAWVDRCVDWCGRHGIYVLQIIHGNGVCSQEKNAPPAAHRSRLATGFRTVSRAAFTFRCRSARRFPPTGHRE